MVAVYWLMFPSGFSSAKVPMIAFIFASGNTFDRELRDKAKKGKSSTVPKLVVASEDAGVDDVTVPPISVMVNV